MRRDDALILSTADIKGNTLIRLKAAPDGTPTLEFLDEAGQVTYALPFHCAMMRRVDTMGKFAGIKILNERS